MKLEPDEFPLPAVMESKQAVLFDLFHTLTALETTWGEGRPFTHQMLGVDKKAWDEQLHRHSRSRLVGEQKDPVAIVAAMARAIDPSISDAAIGAATENRIQRFADALIHIPEKTGDVLRALKSRGKLIGLISNADVMEAAAWSQSPIAGVFDSVIFSCEAGCAKPEPMIYELSLRALGVTPEQAIFVGDGGSEELRGARDLGLTTVMITGVMQEIWPERIPERRQHADFVIEHLNELIEGVRGARP